MNAQGPVRFRDVYANPGYRRLFFAQTASRAGDAFRTVALAVVVFQLTGSGLGTAGVVVAESCPCCYWLRSPGNWSTGCRGAP